MSPFIAALPMYDWPERRAEVDEQWRTIRDQLRASGVEAPETLVRRNSDMPPVPGGIRDAKGNIIAPDPATLPPDELNLHVLWRHPSLLMAQTCYGPMELGLAQSVEIVGQQDYSSVEGGSAEFYSSAIVARASLGIADVPAPADGKPLLPLEALRGRRLAFNSTDSMSGLRALERDLATLGEDLSVFFSGCLESGGHRNSIVAVAEGTADVAAVDCYTWHLAREFEPAAKRVTVVGWTYRRKGLPFVTSRHRDSETIRKVREVLKGLRYC